MKKIRDLSDTEIYDFDGMWIVKISDKPGFSEWLYGQTLPYVEEDSNPCDWAYYNDYARFKLGLGVID